MLSSTEAIDRLARATAYACDKHDGQFRDDNKTPYAVHPLRVMEHLRRIADERDDDVLVAALLHDVIEDCAVTYDSVAERFGTRVAGWVAELTNDSRLPKNERREQMIAHLSEMTPEAKRIKLSDRYDNVLDLLRSGSPVDKRRRYIEETGRILAALTGACRPLEEALREAVERLKVMTPVTQ